ncbi:MULTISPECIES: hypothetical protein [Streptosporangiaceae]|uniref:hypothetical protein n=1 Tax=Streptosporangiaceae TaxID=2004 RepID=UPI00340291ED
MSRNRARLPQSYSAEEFDSVVEQIQSNPQLRADLETIIGQSLEGRPPRELFDTFRAVQGATDVMAVVARYGQARQAVRRTSIELQFDPEVDLQPAAADYTADLQAKLDAEKRRNEELRAALRIAQAPRNVLQLPAADISRPDITRKAVGE